MKAQTQSHFLPPCDTSRQTIFSCLLILLQPAIDFNRTGFFFCWLSVKKRHQKSFFETLETSLFSPCVTFFWLRSIFWHRADSQLAQIRWGDEKKKDTERRTRFSRRPLPNRRFLGKPCSPNLARSNHIFRKTLKRVCRNFLCSNKSVKSCYVLILFRTFWGRNVEKWA